MASKMVRKKKVKRWILIALHQLQNKQNFDRMQFFVLQTSIECRFSC